MVLGALQGAASIPTALFDDTEANASPSAGAGGAASSQPTCAIFLDAELFERSVADVEARPNRVLVSASFRS